MRLDALIADPDIFPQRLDMDGRRVLFVKLTEATIRDAAFLDDRMLRGDVLASWVPLDALAALKPPESPPPMWIFHIGHCGSTLLSRLLPAIAPLLPVREPTVLRTLAESRRASGNPRVPGDDEWPRLFELMVALVARSYRPDQTALIKATSDCNNLVEPALARSPACRALLMYVSLRSYLATMIVDGRPRPDVDGHVASRLRDLRPFLDDPDSLLLDDLAPEHRAAVVWLSGVARLDHAGEALAERVMTLDFDAFLEDAENGLTGIAGFLGLPFDEGDIASAIDGPIMRTYAKAPDHPYTPVSRTAQLAENYARSAKQIDEAMRWTDALVSRHARLAEAIARFPAGDPG